MQVVHISDVPRDRATAITYLEQRLSETRRSCRVAALLGEQLLIQAKAASRDIAEKQLRSLGVRGAGAMEMEDAVQRRSGRGGGRVGGNVGDAEGEDADDFGISVLGDAFGDELFSELKEWSSHGHIFEDDWVEDEEAMRIEEVPSSSLEGSEMSPGDRRWGTAGGGRAGVASPMDMGGEASEVGLPESVWIQVVSGANLPIADFGGTSDPYVTLDIKHEQLAVPKHYKTKVRHGGGLIVVHL